MIGRLNWVLSGRWIELNGNVVLGLGLRAVFASSARPRAVLNHRRGVEWDRPWWREKEKMRDGCGRWDAKWDGSCRWEFGDGMTLA